MKAKWREAGVTVGTDPNRRILPGLLLFLNFALTHTSFAFYRYKTQKMALKNERS